jgi:ketosteroid isomerase-like protein
MPVDLAELIARESIRELVARYAHAADRGRFVELANCFTDDGVLEIAGREPLVGHAAIIEALTGVGADLRGATTVGLIRHHVSSLTIEPDGPDAARAWSYFFAITERGPDHWGRYSDRIVRDRAGHWRFAHRRVRVDGAMPGAWAHQP